MSLPASRSTTYAAGSQVKSDDLNDIQDAIVEGAHGDRTFSFDAGSAQMAGGDWLSEMPWLESATGSETTLRIPQLHAGDRLKSVTLQVQGNGSADLDWYVGKVNADMVGAPTLTGSGQSVANPAGVSIPSTDTPTPYVLAEGEYLFIVLDPSAAGVKVGTVSVTYDHPLP